MLWAQWVNVWGQFQTADVFRAPAAAKRSISCSASCSEAKANCRSVPDACWQAVVVAASMAAALADTSKDLREVNGGVAMNGFPGLVLVLGFGQPAQCMGMQALHIQPVLGLGNARGLGVGTAGVLQVSNHGAVLGDGQYVSV